MPPGRTEDTSRGTRGPVRVGIIGAGAIGGAIASALLERRVEGCGLVGVITRSGSSSRRAGSFDDLVEACDVVVEAASARALATYGPAVVRRGRDLLLVSSGALVDPELRDALRAGPGRVEVSSGAIGGLDLLRAASMGGGLTHVELTTTKPNRSLSEPWMSLDLRRRLEAGDGPLEVFSGTASEAVRRFPRSVNVASALALATLGFERTRVRVVAAPSSDANEHVVRAWGPAGRYEFASVNVPSPENPRTSVITANAVLRRLRERASTFLVGV